MSRDGDDRQHLLSAKDILFKRATGYEAEETEVVMSKDGRPTRIRRTKKHIPADVNALREYQRLYGGKKKEGRTDGQDMDAGMLADILSEVLECTGSQLTDREKLFCLYYVKSFNASLAALKAGYVSNSPQLAAQAGWNILQRKHVQAVIAELRRARFRDLMIDEADVVEQLVKIAFADINDYVEYSDGVIRLRDSALVDGSVIEEVSEGRHGMRVRLADKQRALRMLLDAFRTESAAGGEECE